MSERKPRFKVGQVVCDESGTTLGYSRVVSKFWNAEQWAYKLHDGYEVNEDYLRPLTKRERGARRDSPQRKRRTNDG